MAGGCLEDEALVCRKRINSIFLYYKVHYVVSYAPSISDWGFPTAFMIQLKGHLTSVTPHHFLSLPPVSCMLLPMGPRNSALRTTIYQRLSRMCRRGMGLH